MSLPVPNQPTGIPCPDCKTLIQTTMAELLGERDIYVCPCCGCTLTLMRQASAPALNELTPVYERQKDLERKSRVNL